MTQREIFLTIFEILGILSRNKGGDRYIYPQFLAHESFDITHENVHYIKHYKNMAFDLLCTLCAMQGSLGIVAKCTAAIFALTEDYSESQSLPILDQMSKPSTITFIQIAVCYRVN